MLLLLLSCWVTQADPPESPPPSDSEQADLDLDGDGYPASTDCDDSDSDVNPGQIETCATTDDEDCDSDGCISHTERHAALRKGRTRAGCVRSTC